MATKKSFRQSPAEAFITKPQEEPQDRTETSAGVPFGYRLVRESRSQRQQLLITPSAKEFLAEDAKAKGISMNELMNQIIDEYIKNRRGGNP